MSLDTPPQVSSASPRTGDSIQNSAGGLIAPIDDLIRLNRQIPGAAERLIAMAEEESRHRRDLEREQFSDRCRRADVCLKAQMADMFRGQIFAFVAVLIGLGGGLWLAVQNHAVAGSIFGGGSLISIVSAFIYGRFGRSGSSPELATDEDTPTHGV